MIHYFVDFKPHNGGVFISEEDQVRGYYSKDTNPNMFITRKGAIKEAIKEINRITKDLANQKKDFEKELKELENVK